MPKSEDLPSTLQRSSAKARRTWQETHDSAVKEYGEGRRAHMTAFASLKHSFEKVGDHWEEKDHKGPSDPRSSSSYKNKNHNLTKSYGGVDVNGHSRKELVDRAKQLNLHGYSHMNKDELGEAIEKANNKQTAAARHHK